MHWFASLFKIICRKAILPADAAGAAQTEEFSVRTKQFHHTFYYGNGRKEIETRGSMTWRRKERMYAEY